MVECAIMFPICKTMPASKYRNFYLLCWRMAPLEGYPQLTAGSEEFVHKWSLHHSCHSHSIPISSFLWGVIIVIFITWPLHSHPLQLIVGFDLFPKHLILYFGFGRQVVKWLERGACSPVHGMLTCSSLLALLFMCSIHWDGRGRHCLVFSGWAREQSSGASIFHYRKAEKSRI